MYATPTSLFLNRKQALIQLIMKFLQNIFQQISISLLVICITSLFAQSQQPLFETRILFGQQSHGFVKSGTPVIDRLASGRLVCVFAMTMDINPKKEKYDIMFSYSDDYGLAWSAPELLFNHADANDLDPNLLVDGDRILAFSTTVSNLAKHRIDSTDIYMRTSADGYNWSAEVLLKKPYRYISGKIHRGHRLKNGDLVMGYAWDSYAQMGKPPANEGEMDNRSGVLRSVDRGNTWSASGDIYTSYKRILPKAAGGLCEPATVVLSDGRIMALARTGSDKLYQSWSHDDGISWEIPTPSNLTAHNSPAALWKMDGSDVVLVAWDNSDKDRNPLTVAVSDDGGKTWDKPREVARTEGLQAAYPSILQAKDGTFVMVWHQAIDENKGLEVRMARFNKAWLYQHR